MSGDGIVAVVGLWSLQFLNTEISLDDSPVQVVLYAGVLVFAVGQAVLGRWMATEESSTTPTLLSGGYFDERPISGLLFLANNQNRAS